MPRYQSSSSSVHVSQRPRDIDIDDNLDDGIFSYNNLNANYNFAKCSINSRYNHDGDDFDSPPGSPVRDSKSKSVLRYDDDDFDGRPNPDDMLKMKWIDYGPRMSRLREQRTKRLLNRLEQFEEWDAEQSQKQKQYELAREQRHQNILDRLKTQDFCVDQMLRRHESDIETTRELDTYVKEHLFIEASEDPSAKNRGPINEFRKFEAEMNQKLRHLEDEIETLNPRFKIEQSLLPRLERARDSYSIEPEVYTARGKRVLKRPKLNGAAANGRASEEGRRPGHFSDYDFDDEDYKGIKYYFPTSSNSHDAYDRARLKYNLDKLRAKVDAQECEPEVVVVEKKSSPIKSIISNKKKGPAEFVLEVPAKSPNAEKHVLFKDDLVDGEVKPNGESKPNGEAAENGNVEKEGLEQAAAPQPVAAS